MSEMGKVLVVIGLMLVAVGAVLWSGVGKGWFGRLPGDIHVERENFSFYSPIVTCLILSLALTVILRLLRKQGKVAFKNTEWDRCAVEFALLPRVALG